MTSVSLQTLLAAIFLVLLVLYAGRLRQQPWLAGDFWISFAAGGSISYVFLHILPKLAASDYLLATTLLEAAHLNYHAFFLALVGLLAFQTLERLAGQKSFQSDHPVSARVFWLRTTLYAHYNLLISYLLYYQVSVGGLRSLLLFTLAISLHFIVIDSALFRHASQEQAQKGRWLLAFGLVLGWSASTLGLLSLATLAALLALLAGAMLLNVLNEELTASRTGHWGAFVIGALAYSLLLMTF